MGRHFRHHHTLKRTNDTTASVEMRRQEEEHRYLQGATSVLPKDPPEHNRLDFQHYLLHKV